MFNHVRFRLTTLYVLASALFIVSIAAATYGMVSYYFESANDLALKVRMMQEFQIRNAPVPQELLQATEQWFAAERRYARINPEDADANVRDRLLHEMQEFDGEMAAIFVLFLDANGTHVQNEATHIEPPLSPNTSAIASANQIGRDIRTVMSENGASVRLLTYRLPNATPAKSGPAYLQLGRELEDQARILRQLLAGLAGIGGVALALSAAGCWWLAGRSLRPAKQAMVQQQTFVANASHELRTPLTLIRVGTELLQHNLAKLPEESSENDLLISDALVQCDHMAALIDDLLLLSRLDGKQINLACEPIDLHVMFFELQRQFAPLAAAHEVQIDVRVSGGNALGDAVRLRQVLMILLDNAMRYTPARGHITLSAKPMSGDFLIVVNDTGCGISRDHLGHVFDRFYQVDGSRNHSGKSGLGLSIARGLIEAMGGRITISSMPHVGTSVTIALQCTGQRIRYSSHPRLT